MFKNGARSAGQSASQLGEPESHEKITANAGRFLRRGRAAPGGRSPAPAPAACAPTARPPAARPRRAAGIERHLKTGALNSLVDQRIDVAALVGIAWQGDCRLRSLHRAAQSASLAQIAGL